MQVVSHFSKLSWLLVAALVSVGAACGDGDDGTNNGADGGSDTDVGQDVVEDAEAPEYRSLKASIQGEFSAQVDLANEDQRRVLPIPADVEFTVFATDNETDAENLNVQIVDADGEDLEAESAFSNGLWKLTVEVAPGNTAYVKTSDEAGNATTSEYALIIPPRSEAIQSEWARLFYTRNKSVENRWPVTYANDGTWEMETDDGVIGGTYEADEDTVTVSHTYDEASENGDTDPSTVEERLTMPYYVDSTFFMQAPWTTEGDDTTVEGTWTRSYDLEKPESGELQPFSSVTETLVFNEDGTWSWTRVDTLEAGGTEERSESGSYSLEVSDGYIENFGNYLFIDIESRDGSALADVEQEVWLQRFRLGNMLINPRVAASE